MCSTQQASPPCMPTLRVPVSLSTGTGLSLAAPLGAIARFGQEALTRMFFPSFRGQRTRARGAPAAPAAQCVCVCALVCAVLRKLQFSSPRSTEWPPMVLSWFSRRPLLCSGGFALVLCFLFVCSVFPLSVPYNCPGSRPGPIASSLLLTASVLPELVGLWPLGRTPHLPFSALLTAPFIISLLTL